MASGKLIELPVRAINSTSEVRIGLFVGWYDFYLLVSLSQFSPTLTLTQHIPRLICSGLSVPCTYWVHRRSWAQICFCCLCLQAYKWRLIYYLLLVILIIVLFTTLSYCYYSTCCSVAHRLGVSCLRIGWCAFISCQICWGRTPCSLCWLAVIFTINQSLAVVVFVVTECSTINTHTIRFTGCDSCID